MTAADYREFLARKAGKVEQPGRKVELSEIHPMLYSWQAEIVQWAVRTSRAALWEDTGLGKQQPVTEPVLTPNGWVQMGDLRVGDEVIGSDGKSTLVTGVFPQGIRRVFRLELSDGTFVRAGAEHLWSVRTKSDKFQGRGFRTQTTVELANTVHRAWQLPIVAPVHFNETSLPVNPYELGAILGDGCLRQRTVSLTTDDWIGCNLGYRQVGSHNSNHIGVYVSPDSTRAALVHLGLMGKMSDAKFVPAQYLTANPNDRLALLNGLMDTDGYPMPDGGAEFSSTSRQMVDSVCEIVRSLGGVARGFRRCASTFTYKGENKIGKPAWRVNVKLPNGVPMFTLPRKASIYKSPTKYPPARIVRKVVDEGVDEEQVCISVAADDNLYVTRDYILTHNTLQQIEWARLSGDTSLIIAPLAICQQTVREAAKLDVKAQYVRSGDEVTGPGVWVTNYEMVPRFDAGLFDAVVLDESSCLKDSTGKTRTMLIDWARDIPHRLACSATPAPNDPEELTNQAEWLGRMTRANMLAAYFIHDQDGWRLKGHAKAPMYRWMSEWAVALTKPSDMGGDDTGYILPGLDIISHLVEVDVLPEGHMFAIGADLGGVTGRAQVRRQTLEARVAKAAELVAAEPDEPWLLWCGLNTEADALTKAIPDAVNVHGSLSPEEKARLLLGFADGEFRVMVTKPAIASQGLNYQRCARMAFVGLSDSWEMYYQAIRRCYRFGQTRVVEAHIILSEVESQIAANIARKEQSASEITSALVAEMRRAREEKAA